MRQTKIMEQKPREGHSTVVINYDEKLASECSANPWERKAPPRPAYLEFVRAIVEEFEMKVGFLFVYSDHGKPGARATFEKMMNQASGGSCTITPYEIWYDEDSWRDRCKYKKCTHVEPRETMLVAYIGRSIPVNKRQYYHGSNHGRYWGPLVLDPIGTCMQVEHGKKKIYYGASMRPGGGPPDDEKIDTADGTTGDKITATTMVPFCWRSYPQRFDRCFVQAFQISHIFDFTPGSGGLALAILLEGVGDKMYHAICHTADHMQLLRSHLVQRVLAFMSDDSSALFTALYAKHLKSKDLPTGEPPSQPPKGKGRGRGRKNR